MEQSAEVLRFYRDWITEVPDELTTVVVHRKAPSLPVLPPELHGRPIVTVICCYAGPVEDGERVLRPLKAFGSPLADLCTSKRTSSTRPCSTPRFRRAGGIPSAPATSQP
jgi:hypothetical protein